MKTLIFLFTFFALNSVWAHIPSANLILQRTVENNGTGAYSIENEVQCSSSGQDGFSLKESWLVLGENQMRLTVTGSGDLKDKIKLAYIYNRDQKWQLTASGKAESKLSDEFFERYHHYRDMSAFAGALVKMGVLQPSSLQKKVLKDVDTYKPDPLLRLSRVGGVIAYAFGEPTAPEKASGPGLWIEQDQFFIRKIRTATASEMSVDLVGTFAKGLVYPKSRTIKWGSQLCTIATISVTSKTGAGLANQTNPQALDQISFVDVADASKKSILEDFYKRFR